MLAVSSAFLQQGDYRSATLTARQALAMRPGDPQAVGLLAAITTQTGSPEAILWLERLADLCPGDPGPLFALAQAAVAAREPSIASEALARVSPADLKTASGQAIAGSVAILQKDWPAAEGYFAAAAKLDSNSPQSRLNLAALRLRAPNAPGAAESRAELDRLRALPATQVPALRSLLADARARSARDEARKLAAELHALPQVSYEDRLALLDELAANFLSELKEALAAEQAAAAGDPGRAATLARWMNAHGLAEQAAAWMDGLPEKLRAEPMLLLVRAQSAALRGDWNQVRGLTKDGEAEWAALDFLRLAYGARASVELNHGRRGTDFSARWERAVNATSGTATALSMLASLAQTWDWKAEAVELWWLLAVRPVGARPALERLWRLASEARDSAAMLKVAKRIIELEPANAAALNNLAWLFLVRGEELHRARALAEDNLTRAPDSPGLRLTAALARSFDGRHIEAVALLKHLPSQLFEDPASSADAGLVYAAAGRRAEARSFLETAHAHAAQLLPEEAALVDRALAP